MMRTEKSRSPALTLAAILILAATARASTPVPAAFSGAVEHITFNGICDGSAAVNLGNGTIVVAYDEKNMLFTFSSFGGPPTNEPKKYGTLLGLEDPDDEEADLEGAAIDAQRIWWIGSHGLDGDNNKAPNRRVLFATNFPSADLQDLKVELGPLDILELPEVKDIFKAEAFTRPAKAGGINIEGLATTPDGDLLVGFRSPLSAPKGLSGDALIVRLHKMDNGLELKETYWLDLEDRGVRDLARNGDGYVILAGPVGENGSFALYNWDGDSGMPRFADSLPLNAEAVLDMGDYWLVLSDDGKVKRYDEDESVPDHNRECDKIRKKNPQHGKHPSVFFRAVRIPKRQ